jgi:hypothetical protein
MYFSRRTLDVQVKKRFILNYTTPVATVHRKQQFQKTFILTIGKIVKEIYSFTFPGKKK